MLSRRNNIIILVTVALFLIALFVISAIPNRIAFNPEGTVGNTAGNLNNKGLFCENDGIVYFANAYANGSLYAMNPDGTDIRKLSGAAVEYINAGGKYLYFYQTSSSASAGLASIRSISGVYRSSKNGNSALCLNRDPSGILNLVDNYVYYQHYDVEHGMTFYRTKIDKTDQSELDSIVVNPASVQNGIIYYNGVEKDHYLYAFNTKTNTTSLIWEYDIWNPVVQGNYVYFMDVHNGYALCRYDMTTQEVLTLTTERIDSFNVLNNVIFYQVSSDENPMLCRMNIDGTNIETVAEGVFENINLTSRYAYFNEYDTPVPVYRTSTYDAIQVTTFDAAKEAALKDAADAKAK